MQEKNKIKFKTLHKGISFERILIVILVVVVIGLVVVNRVSYAAYTYSYDVPFVRGKINYKHPDLKVMAMHVQESTGSSTYNETNTMPSGSDYVINKVKSYCNKGSSGEKDTGVVLETVNGRHVIENLIKNDRCYLYFDIKTDTVPNILAKYTKSDSRNGEITTGFKESTPTTVYSAEDDDGISYFFAGENPNNWVKMGDIYYRIIRFNGNGSMRLIYSGTGSPAISGIGTQIGKKEFNTKSDNNMYVGLQYTSGSVHGTETNSKVLGPLTNTDATTLYGWYNTNIKTSYSNVIDTNAGFCNDREPYTDQIGIASGGGTGTTATNYRAYITYQKGGTWQTTYTPTLKCKNSTDLLRLPVGLITADEYALAGGGSPKSSEYYNTTFWLHTGENYWTMSPAGCPSAHMFVANSAGYLNYYLVNYGYGVRPVINLKSTTTFSSGTGEINNPYVVSGN